jgi:peroxiredoxin
MKIHLTIIAATTLWFTTAIALAAGPEPGSAAPDFTLIDTSGKEHSLSDFRGKFVVLEWTNFGCPFVKKHYDSNNMQSLQKKYTEKDVVWLSICSSAEGRQGHFPPGKWNELIKEKGAEPTAVLLDEKGEVGKLYGATTTPDMFIIDKKGTLIYRGAIDSIRSVDQSDIPKATNYVSAALDSKMAGKPVKNASTKPYGCSVKYR